MDQISPRDISSVRGILGKDKFPWYFCLLTTGRAGSTSLIRALGSWKDVLIPGKLLADCEDDELVHPQRVANYCGQARNWSGDSVADSKQLIDWFFKEGIRKGAAFRYVGFKSMPDHHSQFLDFVQQTDIQFITLVREDVVSTIASYQVALSTDCWRRSGERQHRLWTLLPEGRASVLETLRFITTCRDLIAQIPRAIRLTFEDLCSLDFACYELNEFFGRPVRLTNPRPPVHGSEYVTNWYEFNDFAQNAMAQLHALKKL